MGKQTQTQTLGLNSNLLYPTNTTMPLVHDLDLNQLRTLEPKPWTLNNLLSRNPNPETRSRQIKVNEHLAFTFLG